MSLLLHHSSLIGSYIRCPTRYTIYYSCLVVVLSPSVSWVSIGCCLFINYPSTYLLLAVNILYCPSESMIYIISPIITTYSCFWCIRITRLCFWCIVIAYASHASLSPIELSIRPPISRRAASAYACTLAHVGMSLFWVNGCCCSSSWALAYVSTACLCAEGLEFAVSVAFRTAAW
jgi:hypothetical protein